MAPYVAGGLFAGGLFAGELDDVDAETVAELEAMTVPACPTCTTVPHPDGTEHTEPAPPLSRAQVLKLEALTARWTREVRVTASPDDTLLYASSAMPPPPPVTRPRLELVADVAPPIPDEETVRERSEELLEEETPSPAPAPGPGLDQEPATARRRVSDWVSEHDPRSLAYAVRQRLGRAVPLQDVSLVAGPVLDQGTAPPLSVRDASACVGMALTAAANVLELRPRVGPREGTLPNRLRYEDDARELYELAQRRDHVHGTDYAGTSVLGGLKAGRELGLWDEFLWALGGTRDIAQVLLQLRVAVVVGVPWDSSLETPDAAGVITPGGTPAGGHALAVVGLRQFLPGRDGLPLTARPGPWFELQQSRGPAEGLGGRVFIHHRHLAQLLAGVGEAGVPLPR